MKYGLIGERLGHSFSAEVHAELGDYSYELCEIPRGALENFMKTSDFLGINVTIPYKKAIIPYLDELDGSVSDTDAVNTVVRRCGRLIGYNTDVYGILGRHDCHAVTEGMCLHDENPVFTRQCREGF